MGSKKIRVSLIVTLLSILILFQTSQAQDSPQDYLDTHNAARAEVGVGPLTWNDDVASFAQRYVRQLAGDCNLIHSGGPYGENLAMRSPNLNAAGAVEMWVQEKANYNYGSNSCGPGEVCGHYTQVVWRDSVRLGCAKVTCANNGGDIVSCNYDPPGNFIGQRPY